MNKARHNITVECPNCGTSVNADLDKFLDDKRAIWRLIVLQIKSGYKKQELIGTLAMCSAKETLLNEIEENGALITICLSCMTEILKKSYISRANKVSQKFINS